MDGNEVPTRVFFAGRRWRVSDTPTRLSESVWSLPLEGPRSMFGWRCQGTDEHGEALVFDLYPDETGWHVRHTYR